MLEVCLCVYKRHYRLPELMKQLRNQTYKDFRLNIWNNSDRFIDNRNFGKINLLYQGKNIGSQARFRMVSKIGGDPIIFIDDDLALEKDFIEYNLGQWEKFGKNCVLGWYSKKWDEEDYHKDKAKLPETWFADYIGTGGMIIGREIFDKEPSLQNIPEKYAKVEDLYLSYLARKNGMDLISIKPKCRIMHDGNDQYKALRQYKQEAFISLRKEGWKLLKDL